MSERSREDICEELESLRRSVRTLSDEKRGLTTENEKLTRDLENTQILLNLCLDTLKRHKIAVRS